VAAGRLEGKVALITGGTRGIGRRAVERFCEQGAAVCFTGRNEGYGRELAERSGAHFIPADVADSTDTERSFSEVLDRHGRLDILVNNAGDPGPVGRIENVDLADFDRTMAIHVRGTFAHIRAAAPVMRAQKSGSIVNIASVAGHRTGALSAVYSAAKAAVLHLTRCAAMELGEDNVRVNSVSPGVIATGIHAKAIGIEDERADRIAELMPAHIARLQAVPRAGMPDDVAEALIWLASDEARFVNGSDLVVDGGLIWGRRFSDSLGFTGNGNRAQERGD
jgi:NAD(P)-dependent dehydrogenase (short-subunit alcohol dehydrogenase family)